MYADGGPSVGSMQAPVPPPPSRAPPASRPSKRRHSASKARRSPASATAKARASSASAVSPLAASSALRSRSQDASSASSSTSSLQPPLRPALHPASVAAASRRLRAFARASSARCSKSVPTQPNSASNCAEASATCFGNNTPEASSESNLGPPAYSASACNLASASCSRRRFEGVSSARGSGGCAPGGRFMRAKGHSEA
mmetsp:Transcript_4999/g.18704  ORF Transcript_4999/g.18704 Transcript_4999/m.18704 type:complete len:200 (+) Transcript_4999:205-804(+)